MGEIVLEGSDYTGKTTLNKILGELNLESSDRSPEISRHIQLGDIEASVSAAAESIAHKHGDDLVVLLIAEDPDILTKRRDTVGVTDEYDIQAEAYNRVYQALADRLREREAPNIVVIPIDNQSTHDLTRQTIEPWAERHIGSFDFEEPTIEGRSKRIHAFGSIALAELKPSLFSITHNRYDENVEGTDELRVDFWELFGQHLNRRMAEQAMGQGDSEELQKLLDAGIVDEKYPFLSNFLGRLALNDKDVIITRFADEIPPLEVVWKKYLVGTMKHRLLDVGQYPMRDGKYLNYEDEFPNDFIRFDWRNPIPDAQLTGNVTRLVEDETIPDDFADFFMNTRQAKEVAMAVAHATDEMLQSAGYMFVDTCYFMNKEGNLVYSEITPDGMRIKSKHEDGSFDKDLWRQGKDPETLRRIWGKLLSDLREI